MLGFALIERSDIFTPWILLQVQDALIVSLTNSAVSIFAGFAVFSVLGHLSTKSGMSIEDLGFAGPGLAFQTYPVCYILFRLRTWRDQCEFKARENFSKCDPFHDRSSRTCSAVIHFYERENVLITVVDV